MRKQELAGGKYELIMRFLQSCINYKLNGRVTNLNILEFLMRKISCLQSPIKNMELRIIKLIIITLIVNILNFYVQESIQCSVEKGVTQKK